MDVDGAGLVVFDGEGHVRNWESIQADVVRLALLVCKNDRKKAARQLQVSKNKFYAAMKRNRIPLKHPRKTDQRPTDTLDEEA